MAAMNLDTETFHKMIAGDKPVLVDYWAPGCGYCRRIEPAYEKIAEQYGDSLVVGKINIDEERQLAAKEQIGVIPTLVLYQKGEATAAIFSPESTAAIEAFIHENLAKL